MPDNIKVMVLGAGQMAREYFKVLNALKIKPIIVGRGEKKAIEFQKEMGISVLCGGIDNVISDIGEIPQYAINAVSVHELAETTKLLLDYGVKNILVEKPGGLNRREIEEVVNFSKKKDAKVYVAYNRRFYASVEKALEIIEDDNGVTSFNFEFTEWAPVDRTKQIEHRFLANSSHVVDLAFFLGGFPVEMSTYVQGGLDWHRRGCVYAGAGISEKGALFSYQANWDAPGRWAVEILTQKHRLYFKPMEKLQIQEKASVAVNPVNIDDRLDIEFKPGLYRQVESFLNSVDDGKKITIEEQLVHMDFYEKIDGIYVKN